MAIFFLKYSFNINVWCAFPKQRSSYARETGMCSVLCALEKSSESGCGGNGEPVLESEPPQIADENSCSSHFSISDCLRVPEEPDLADRSSQSSLNSQDDAGTCSKTHTHQQRHKTHTDTQMSIEISETLVTHMLHKLCTRNLEFINLCIFNQL